MRGFLGDNYISTEVLIISALVLSLLFSVLMAKPPESSVLRWLHTVSHQSSESNIHNFFGTIFRTLIYISVGKGYKSN